MRLKIVLLSSFLCCFSLCATKAHAQDSFEVSIGIRADDFTINRTRINDSLSVRGWLGNENRATVLLSYNKELRKNLYAKLGIRFHHIFYSYTIQGKSNKVGGPRMATFTFPLHVKYIFPGKKFYAEGGIQYSFGFIPEIAESFFRDVPYVSQPYNDMYDTFKNNFFSYNIGLGIMLNRFSLGVLVSKSMVPVANPLVYESQSYQVFNRLTSYHLDLSYRFMYFKKNN